MVMTRRREAPILSKTADSYHDSLLDSGSFADSSDDLLGYDTDSNEDTHDSIASTKHTRKRRKVCGWIIHTPNTSQFANTIHSRVLHKYPFLIEMFYWIITYLFYRMTKVISQRIFSEEIWDVAQAHGLQILDFEQFSPLSFLFPLKEHSVQFWFMERHQTALTILNRAYALIHIPGTVGYDIPFTHSCKAHRCSNALQLHRLVLLHRSLLRHLRKHSTHPNPYQPFCLPDIHPLPLHATSSTTSRIRLP